MGILYLVGVYISLLGFLMPTRWMVLMVNAPPLRTYFVSVLECFVGVPRINMVWDSPALKSNMPV
jgi:hypothetical protein